MGFKIKFTEEARMIYVLYHASPEACEAKAQEMLEEFMKTLVEG